ncbi:AABR07072562.1 [Phodopus roborovskii]|uniref:AABR07072562.1 protein n=1 Tax=Phodopus roborovskii TaxID=109678 RepID=A0AAU9ZZX5_PHORO|nr:AABR07072562.1 [Phodopus roborovskii]
MRRQQYKKTSNNRKTSMTPPESRDSTPTRSEHPKADEAEENDLKNIFIKMIEALKDDLRKPLKEMEEKTNKKLEEMKRSLKERKAKKKTIKQVKETVQDLKTEIETIKKTQTEEMLEIEKLEK